MVVLSKILHPFHTTLSCHELAHTWTSSCPSAAAGVFRSCMVESLKIYGLLYLVGGILRKAGLKYFKYQYVLDVIRSSCFLAINGGGFVVNVCLLRKLLGCFTYISVVFFPGLIASFTAIITEKKGRRGTLALYMTNLAVETSYNMLKERGLIQPIPNGEILLFCVATATMMYLYRKKDGLTDGLLNNLVRFFMGPDGSGHRQEISSSQTSVAIDRRESRMQIKWLRPTLKAFGIGYLTQLAPLLLGQIKSIFKRPGRLLRTFYNKDCIRCGLFLGSLVATFKIVEWELELLRKKRDEFNALVAGGLAGLSMMWYRSSSIALYLASKLSEVRVKEFLPFFFPLNCKLVLKEELMHLSDCKLFYLILFRFFMGPDGSGHRQEISSSQTSVAIDRRESRMQIKWLRPTLKAFGIGYLTQLAPLLLGQIKSIFKRPGRLLRTFYNKDCIRCGLFLGSLVATFKIVEWELELLRKKRDEFNALVAGGLAGLSMMWYRSSSIALYLASKLSEVLYKRGIAAGILPSIPYAEILTYSFSTAFLFHACVWEVHSVRPSYWRYLNVVTAKRFCELNREKADELFGTDSARLFPKKDLYKSLRRR
ncbi:transmembrane protein 135-like [Orbicella faveolata]|uniref:transmembrane protein 135-like n=1 Tax=Orbicella faveolata TaxID=48498 RepID=UPI0009E5578F|nr:transmembrane protein 135-like [Orbicella faveolata]